MTTNVSSGPTKYKFLLTDLEDEGRETGALGNERETGEQRGTGTKGELQRGETGAKGADWESGAKKFKKFKIQVQTKSKKLTKYSFLMTRITQVF